MTEEASEICSPDDVMKILVATDIHLGYCEKDTERGEDSFITFEEILQHATVNEVDLILLGGDLFHDANPSQSALQKCMRHLRTYCFGDKPIFIEFLSDQSVNFQHSLNQTVNYLDPNLNVSIPVFSIHGNHDDPCGSGGLSSLDILSTSGLVNYFGKWTDLTKVEVKPLLIRKNETQVALYGLSYINDARLARLFQESKVPMETPDPSTGDWFNIMVLHQNRAERGRKMFVPETSLPNFLDLVIWGHEHDCRIKPEYISKNDVRISQPGSSVATSLAEGEAIDKHCGLLTIHKKKFKMEPIRLKSVRPFIFKSIDLTDFIEERGLDEGDVQTKVMELVTENVEEMITKAKEKITDDETQPKLPLIRLRVLYSEEQQMFNTIRFGQHYNARVANPMDLILLKRSARSKKFKIEGVDKMKFEEAFEAEREDIDVKVEDIVEKYFEEAEDNKKLQIVSSKAFSELCRRLVDNNDDDAADRIVSFYNDKACEFLCEHMPDEDGINDELVKFREKSDKLFEQILEDLDSRAAKGESRIEQNDIMDVDDFSDNKSTKDNNSSTNLTAKGSNRGRGRGRGSRGARGRGTTKKPEVEIPKLTSDQRQKCLLYQSLHKKKKEVTYEISSDSD